MKIPHLSKNEKDLIGAMPLSPLEQRRLEAAGAGLVEPKLREALEEIAAGRKPRIIANGPPPAPDPYQVEGPGLDVEAIAAQAVAAFTAAYGRIGLVALARLVRAIHGKRKKRER